METQRKKILLIDDNEVIRIMFSNIFWLHGLSDTHNLAVVESTAKALPLVKDPETRPDIIFMGLVMPFEKNGKTETSAEAGFSFLRAVKDDPETRDVHVVIFSSYDEEDQRTQAFSLGAEKYIKKGDNMPQDIIEIVRSFDAN